MSNYRYMRFLNEASKSMDYYKLVKYFERYGVTFKQQEPLVLLGIETEYQKLVLVAEITEGWLTFQLPEYISDPMPSDQAMFLSALMFFNADQGGVKFGMSDTGDITLSLDLPARDLSYSHFVFGLETLLGTAEALYIQVSAARKFTSQTKIEGAEES